jgi:hypothetical protein
MATSAQHDRVARQGVRELTPEESCIWSPEVVSTPYVAFRTHWPLQVRSVEQPCSPLLYPGGKSGLLDLVALILRLNDLERGHDGERYAGG